MGFDYRFWVWKIREALGISVESQMLALDIKPKNQASLLETLMAL